jgi:phage shock protein E
VPQKLLLSFLPDNTTLTLFDARSPEEFAVSRIGGAINVPHDSAVEAAEVLPADRSEPIVVYCKTGIRAGALRHQLQERGYSDVRIFQPDQVFWFDGITVFNCGVPSQEMG